MTLNRIIHTYGDKSPLYAVSMWLFFFGTSWLCVRYGEIGLGSVFPRVLALFLVIHFVDAIIKGAVFTKDQLKFVKTILSSHRSFQCPH